MAKKENFICPFCKAQNDKPPDDILELIKKATFYEMFSAYLHVIKNSIGGLRFYIRNMMDGINENQSIISEKYLPELKYGFAKIEKYLKEIITYFSSMQHLFFRSYYTRRPDTIEILPDQINSILELYNCKVKIDDSLFKKRKLFIDINDYITVFALVLHDTLLFIRRAINPQIDISFVFEESNLKTVFEISHSLNIAHRDSYPFEETRNFWDWPKYVIKIVKGEISIKEDNGKTIIIFEIPFVNREKNVEEGT